MYFSSMIRYFFIRNDFYDEKIINLSMCSKGDALCVEEERVPPFWHQTMVRTSLTGGVGVMVQVILA